MPWNNWNLNQQFFLLLFCSIRCHLYVKAFMENNCILIIKRYGSLIWIFIYTPPLLLPIYYYISSLKETLYLQMFCTSVERKLTTLAPVTVFWINKIPSTNDEQHFHWKMMILEYKNCGKLITIKVVQLWTFSTKTRSTFETNFVINIYFAQSL